MVGAVVTGGFVLLGAVVTGVFAAVVVVVLEAEGAVVVLEGTVEEAEDVLDVLGEVVEAPDAELSAGLSEQPAAVRASSAAESIPEIRRRIAVVFKLFILSFGLVPGMKKGTGATSHLTG